LTTSQVTATLLLATVLAACGAQRGIPTAPHITTFSAIPDTLAATGGDATLRWEVQGAVTELVVTPGVGPVSGSSVRVSPEVTTRYTLTASNAVGRHSARTTVKVPEAPGLSGVPNADLTGPWVFEIAGDRGTRVSGELHLDTAVTYGGVAALWGAVSDCRGAEAVCEGAPSGGLIHEPGTDVYRFALGEVDGALAFIGRDEDGRLAQNVPLHFMLEGRGTVGEGEPATFVAYQLGK